MAAHASPKDIAFKTRFETGQVSTSEFNHRAHLRLIYVYLCENSVADAHKNMKHSLTKFLKDNDVPPTKYHETLTLSWTQAVKHFMVKAGEVQSFDAFVAQDERLLDTSIMLTHYSSERLFSEDARAAFVAPDLAPIPEHP